MALALQFQGDLRAVGGFTGTLQTDHHDDGGRVLGFTESGLGAAHEFRQLFIDDFDDHLGRGQAGHDLGADGALRDFRREVFCDLVADVRFQQRQPHFAHGFTNILFVQGALALQTLEGAFKPV